MIFSSAANDRLQKVLTRRTQIFYLNTNSGLVFNFVLQFLISLVFEKLFFKFKLGFSLKTSQTIFDQSLI